MRAALVGIVVSLLVLFISHSPFLRRIENLFIDLRFQFRDPIPTSPAIVHVDIDNESIDELGPFIARPRTYHASVIQALDELGAAVIVFDIEFSRLHDTTTEFSTETGRFSLKDQDEAVRAVMASTGKVVIPFALDFTGDLSRVLDALPAATRALRENAAVSSADLAAATGMRYEEFSAHAGALRRFGLRAVAREFLEEDPKQPFAAFAGLLLPDESEHNGHMDGLKRAWDAVHAEHVLLGKTQTVEGPSDERWRADGVLDNPGHREFNESAVGCGMLNIFPDSDGSLRRIPLFVRHGERVLPHMGVLAALQWLQSEGHGPLSL